MLKKKSLLISIIVVVCAVVIIAIFSLKKDGDQNNNEKEKVIKEYFKAINDKDLDAIYDVGYPKSVKNQIADKSKLNSINLLDFYTNTTTPKTLGFTRGLYEVEHLKKRTMYSYPNVEQGLSAEEVQKQTLSMLNVKYNILDIQPFEKLKVVGSTAMGDKQLSFDDIEDRLYRKDFKTGDVMYDIEIEDLYIAILDVEWSYGDMLYGMDKSWWNDEAISYTLSDTYDKTYDSAINNMKTIDGNPKVYVLFLYKYDGDWYIIEPEKLGTMQGTYLNGTVTRGWY